ncbi:hypothetical protein PAXRUDRAFT_833288 [Paxillus rubicundulus Ve08.2h10]|uniref:Uncharacterized protein n=1 Tax=Paxillus rubicundulus Ve08.2h10 TaxID=930991 RepID=A0A0D0CDV3_9AGAM|nr:hypothetical protein PAXRUDRAFT_833288 [Paxillus rubicundulus Ve08.2h10]
MSYPLDWLCRTFPTRERTIELLRPELEDNALSRHDYELATRFLPGPHQRWSIVYAGGVSGAAFGYGYYVARPRWSVAKLGFGTAAAFMLGMTFGAFRQFMAHYQFANSLEDPQGFMNALNHVDKRLGGSGSIGFTLQRIRRESLEAGQGTDHAKHILGPEMVREEDWGEQQDNTNANMSRPTETTSRQRHERTKLPNSKSSPRDGTPTSEADQRAAAQAKFDALLEAERCSGQSQDDRESV